MVNGGLDQKAYLLFPAQNEFTARKELHDYEKRISPFKEREARFCEIIGPPLTPISVHPKLTTKNLQVLESLSLINFWQQAPSAAVRGQASLFPGTNVGRVFFELHRNHAVTSSRFLLSSRPTSSKILQRLRSDNRGQLSGWLGESGMSTSTAKFHELENAFKSLTQKHAIEMLLIDYNRWSASSLASKTSTKNWIPSNNLCPADSTLSKNAFCNPYPPHHRPLLPQPKLWKKKCLL
jgi:hypothetical protein